MILFITKLKEMNQNKKISRIKFNAYKLYNNRQIPKYLFDCIIRIGSDISIEELKFYMELCEHYMRIKGYYGKYAEVDLQAEKEIKELQNKFHY